MTTSVYKILFSGPSTMGTGHTGHAQDWHPGDTLKIVAKDTTRIDQFRDNMIDYTGQDLIDASYPIFWPLFGSQTQIATGGYFKMDYIQDFDGDCDRFQCEVQNVSISGDGRPPQKGYMNLHALESRMNPNIRRVAENGRPVRFFFDFDFCNLDREAFAQTPRLRHLCAVFGRLLVGCTWGTQTDLCAFPTTLDSAIKDALDGDIDLSQFLLGANGVLPVLMPVTEPGISLS